MSDPVNHPEHYTASYVKGNAIKYCWRERYKGGEQDLDKAVWYLTHR